MDDIQFIPPDQCKDCGWMPAVRTDDKQVIKTENSWLITIFPGSTLALFTGPACTCIHANKNILDNVEKLREMKKNKSGLWTPPKGTGGSFLGSNN